MAEQESEFQDPQSHDRPFAESLGLLSALNPDIVHQLIDVLPRNARQEFAQASSPLHTIASQTPISRNTLAITSVANGDISAAYDAVQTAPTVDTADGDALVTPRSLVPSLSEMARRVDLIQQQLDEWVEDVVPELENVSFMASWSVQWQVLRRTFSETQMRIYKTLTTAESRAKLASVIVAQHRLGYDDDAEQYADVLQKYQLMLAFTKNQQKVPDLFSRFQYGGILFSGRIHPLRRPRGSRLLVYPVLAFYPILP